MTSKIKKALSPRTIIPDELYVERDADRQLRNVVEDMGRPAYILVARQMGKTNLLLRMKRQRELSNELAVYVDLSTGFKSARALFRHLVDSIVDIEELDELRESLQAERSGSSLDPSVEFDRHLRRALAASKKDRVIIILDEIDSLVGHSYSDRILSQIRSMYFARANHAIYEKLTYVLSGVAEPSDLIKDKNISPFNIGEKIYLNDFSRSEVAKLLDLAEIELDLDIQDLVFDWTKGNPRMTWDVLSALEDAVASQELVSEATVNSIIQKLYLDRYDRAPLDHIRSLAESDAEVRSALMALLYGKGSTLSDRAKSKLYLAGITTASSDDAPKIKNRVIEAALSESWLAQVEAGRDGLLRAAGSRYDENEYADALELYSQFFSSGGELEAIGELDLFRYALTIYNAGDLKEAPKLLELAASVQRSPEVKELLKYTSGTAKTLLGETTEAIEILEPIAEKSGPYSLRAKHGLGTAYLKAGLLENADRIIRINQEVLTALEEETELPDSDKPEIRAACYYNLGQVFEAQGRKCEAKSSFASAFRSAEPVKKPAFATAYLGLESSEGARKRTLELLSDILRTEKVPYSLGRGALSFDKYDMGVFIATSIEGNHSESFASLLKVAVDLSGASEFETLVELASLPNWKAKDPRVVAMVKTALTDKTIFEEGLLKQKIIAARIWIQFADIETQDEAFDFYWGIISSDDALEFLSFTDVILIASRIRDLLKNGRLFEAKKLANFVRSNEKHIDERASPLFAFFVYQEMVLHRIENEVSNAIKSAREILKLTSGQDAEGDIRSPQLVALYERLRQAASIQLTDGSAKTKKYGRNEIVVVRDTSTNITFSAKFKKVMDRVKSGQLEIIDE